MRRYSIRAIVAALFLIFTLGLNAQSQQVLMTIGNHQISADNFVYLFLKNDTKKVDKHDIEKYLTLFKNFKLKVIEAQSLGYDTTASFKMEYNSYRNQVAANYLMDRNMEQKLIDEAYRHLKEDVELSHILLRFPPNATPSDTLATYKKALSVIKRLKKENFSQVALSVSDDSSVKENKGNIGWFTGQMVAYPLEEAMYSSPIGKVSMPIRTDYGYHIIKVTGRRPAVGKVQVAHIFKKYPEQATDAQKESVHKSILFIEELLKEGEKFEELASTNSDDHSSASQGGVLPYFGVGRMVGEFERAAFALRNKGDISAPIETQYGWHILKLIDKKPVESFEVLKPEILRSFARDGRSQVCRNAFVDKLKKDYNYKRNEANFQELIEYAKKHTHPDSNYLSGADKFRKPLFTIKDHNVTQDNYIKYIYLSSKSNVDNTVNQTYGLYDKFVNEEILRFEDSQLEQKYPEFKQLLQEYHDGILLFNISNDVIWSKSSNDTIGLERYFAQNAQKYKWDIPRYKGRIFYCKDKKISKDLQKRALKMSDTDIAAYIAKINKDSMIVDTEQGMWVKGDNKVVDNLGFKDKNAVFTPTSKYPYVFVVGKVMNAPASYHDVRAAVVSDYQDYLESEWVKALEKKYPVVINRTVLKALEERLVK